VWQRAVQREQRLHDQVWRVMQAELTEFLPWPSRKTSFAFRGGFFL
jgi:predicted kinase